MPFGGKISKRRNSGAVLLGTFMVPAAFSAASQNTSATKVIQDVAASGAKILNNQNFWGRSVLNVIFVGIILFMGVALVHLYNENKKLKKKNGFLQGSGKRLQVEFSENNSQESRLDELRVLDTSLQDEQAAGYEKMYFETQKVLEQKESDLDELMKKNANITRELTNEKKGNEQLQNEIEKLKKESELLKNSGELQRTAIDEYKKEAERLKNEWHEAIKSARPVYDENKRLKKLLKENKLEFKNSEETDKIIKQLNEEDLDKKRKEFGKKLAAYFKKTDKGTKGDYNKDREVCLLKFLEEGYWDLDMCYTVFKVSPEDLKTMLKEGDDIEYINTHFKDKEFIEVYLDGFMSDDKSLGFCIDNNENGKCTKKYLRSRNLGEFDILEFCNFLLKGVSELKNREKMLEINYSEKFKDFEVKLKSRVENETIKSSFLENLVNTEDCYLRDEDFVIHKQSRKGFFEKVFCMSNSFKDRGYDVGFRDPILPRRCIGKCFKVSKQEALNIAFVFLEDEESRNLLERFEEDYVRIKILKTKNDYFEFEVLNTSNAPIGASFQSYLSTSNFYDVDQLHKYLDEQLKDNDDNNDNSDIDIDISSYIE